MKGAHVAKGKCMRVKRKCVWRDIDASNVKRGKKDFGRKIKGKRAKEEN